MKPGATNRPVASISGALPAVTSPTSATRSPSSATSARSGSAPVPSSTVPPRITSSITGGILPAPAPGKPAPPCHRGGRCNPRPSWSLRRACGSSPVPPVGGAQLPPLLEAREGEGLPGGVAEQPARERRGDELADRGPELEAVAAAAAGEQEAGGVAGGA